MNFNEHLFRASESSHLTTGSIGITKDQEKEIESLIFERDNGINLNGNKVKWTENKIQKLNKLESELANPTIPKGMITELRKIFRSVKYNRRFMFSNKYVQKGISHEEESFSTYQKYLEEVKGIKFLLMNNKERLNGEFFTGESDCNEHFARKYNWGFDVKTSWSLETFPFEDDKLDSTYYWQNIVYMILYREVLGIEVDHWKTAYILVNSSEKILNDAKMKEFYNTEMHQHERNEEKYIELCRNLEKLHIVDYDRFKFLYPGHDLFIGRDEWMENNLDIPLSERVVEKRVDYNQSDVDFIKQRAIIGRNYLNTI